MVGAFMVDLNRDRLYKVQVFSINFEFHRDMR